jgi:DNA-binding transcriptional MerR regulator
MYRVSDFAEKAGVTVRTLHHYDRLGLLKPSGRTEAGYRLYGERDFARLQQIVTLKFIGLPLRQIKDLLDRRRSGPGGHAPPATAHAAGKASAGGSGDSGHRRSGTLA